MNCVAKVWTAGPSLGPTRLQDQRGRGLLRAMLETLRALLPGREGVGFVRADNAASLAAHDKLGLRRVARFSCSGVDYVVVVFDG
jgi:L-amino acid N-acyltransferase YncA